MSLRFTATNQIASFRGVSLAQNAFTRIVRVRLDGAQPGEQSLLSLHTTALEVHEVYTNAAGDWWTLGRSYNAGSVPLQGPGAPKSPGTWYDLAIVGLTVSGTTRLRAYVKPAGELVASEYELPNPSSGTIDGAFLGAPFVTYSAIATYSNSKSYARGLTKAQVEAEMNSKAVVDPTGLLEYNDLIGDDLAAVLSSIDSQPLWDVLRHVDMASVTGAAPIRSTDEPQWSAPTLGWTSIVEQPYGDVTPGEWAPGFALGARTVTDGTAQTFRFTHGASSSSAMLLAFSIADMQASGNVRGTTAAALQTGIRLRAQSNVSGQVAASVRTSPLLAAGATGRATGTANLTTQIRLAGAASAAVVGAANPTFPDRIFLNAEGQVTAAAAAGLVALPLLRGGAVGRVTGSADLSKPIDLAAAGQVDSSSIATFDSLVIGPLRMNVTQRRLQFTAT